MPPARRMIDKDHLTGSKRFEPIPADHAIIRFPGGEGGPEWAGGAFDPKLGLFIVNTNNFGYIEKLVQQPNGEWNMTAGRFVDPQDASFIASNPPWGMLTAVNVNTGDIAWQVNLGISDSLPEGKKNTGRPSNGGPIVTASGVTFIGGTDDQRFRAFDSKTGKELWTYHARLFRPCHAHHLSGQGWAAICGDRGDRRLLSRQPRRRRQSDACSRLDRQSSASLTDRSRRPPGRDRC